MTQIKNSGMQKDHEKIDPTEFPGKDLGGKLGNVFIRFVKSIINSTTDWFEDRLINFAVGVLVKIEQSGKSIFAPLIKELKDKGAIPDFLKPIFDEVEDPKHEIGALLGQSVGGGAIGGIFGAIFDPLMAQTKYLLQRKIKPYQPEINLGVLGKLQGNYTLNELKDLIQDHGFNEAMLNFFIDLHKNHIPFNELLELKHRGKLTDTQFKIRVGKLGFDKSDMELLENVLYKIPEITSSIIAFYRNEISKTELDVIAEKNGIDTEFLTILITANRKIIDVSDLRTIYYRANKTDTWLKEELSKIGYNDQAISDLKEIFPYFPQVQDLITFAVREVYSPGIRSEYGLDDDFPSEFADQALKQGVTLEQAKNYWASHWILPSIQMGYEMLHRDVINTDQLKTLMRTQDIMPYWREKLIDISYNPLTRVDVRRMYNTGTLGEAEVLEAYKAVGYNDKNARLMTDFTKNFYQPAEKRLSRTDILDGYKRKFLNESEATQLLEFLGYDPDEIMFYFAKVDHKEAEEDKKEVISLVKDMYKKGIINDNEAISQLNTGGVEMAEIKYYIDKWAVSKISKPAKPAKEDLKAWLIGKIVSRETYVEEMRSLGYADKYINNYLLQYKQPGL